MQKLTLILSLLMIAPSAFATSCPPASAWSHEPGQPWTLNAPGWKAETQGYYAKNSELTKMPDTVQATVKIIDTRFYSYNNSRRYSGDRNNIDCIYYNETYDPFGFISKNWVQAELLELDKQKLEGTIPSNFIREYIDQNIDIEVPLVTESKYTCQFYAGNPETCAWGSDVS